MLYHWDFGFLLNYRHVLLQGLLNTALLSATVLACGVVIGCMMAGARLSKSKILRATGTIYVELLRNMPALVLLFWFFYTIPVLTGIQNDRFLTAATAFSLYTSAYFCEIFRSGIQTIPRGQWQAAEALGFSRWKNFANIILPQAIRNVLPALTNEAVEVVKISAVASSIAFPELLYQAKLLSDTEYRPVEAYSAVAVLMIALILCLSTLSYYLEARLEKAR